MLHMASHNGITTSKVMWKDTCSIITLEVWSWVYHYNFFSDNSYQHTIPMCPRVPSYLYAFAHTAPFVLHSHPMPANLSCPNLTWILVGNSNTTLSIKFFPTMPLLTWNFIISLAHYAFSFNNNMMSYKNLGDKVWGLCIQPTSSISVLSAVYPNYYP